MPDFNIVIMQQCRPVRHASVGGYEQDGLCDERTWPGCTCPAYKLGKRKINFGGRMVPKECKHIKQAQESACGWHEQFSDERQSKAGTCPRCGGETEPVRVAV